MALTRGIVVTLPEDLLVSVENLSCGRGGRNAFICEAIRLLVSERGQTANLERLQKGYAAMGRINLELAEEGLGDDLGAFETYERALSERESG